MRYIEVQGHMIPILYDMCALEKTVELFDTANPMEVMVLRDDTVDKTDSKAVMKLNTNRINMVVMMACNASEYLGTPMTLTATQLRHMVPYEFANVITEAIKEILSAFRRDIKDKLEGDTIDGYLEEEKAKNP